MKNTSLLVSHASCQMTEKPVTPFRNHHIVQQENLSSSEEACTCDLDSQLFACRFSTRCFFCARIGVSILLSVVAAAALI